MRRRYWIAALVVTIVHVLVFAADTVNVVVEVREFPACDWYCGRIPYVIAIFLPFFHLLSWVTAIVLAVLAIRTRGRSRVIGTVCLVLCTATALTLVLQVSTLFAVG